MQIGSEIFKNQQSGPPSNRCQRVQIQPYENSIPIKTLHKAHYAGVKMKSTLASHATELENLSQSRTFLYVSDNQLLSMALTNFRFPCSTFDPKER